MYLGQISFPCRMYMHLSMELAIWLEMVLHHMFENKKRVLEFNTTISRTEFSQWSGSILGVPSDL